MTDIYLGLVSSSGVGSSGLFSRTGEGDAGLSRSFEKSAFKRSGLFLPPLALRAHDRSVMKI